MTGRSLPAGSQALRPGPSPGLADATYCVRRMQAAGVEGWGVTSVSVYELTGNLGDDMPVLSRGAKVLSGVVLAAIFFLVVVSAAAYFYLQREDAGGALRQRIAWEAGRFLGLPVSIGGLHYGGAGWVVLKDVRVGAGPDGDGSQVLQVPQLAVSFSLVQLVSDWWHTRQVQPVPAIRAIRLVGPRLVLAYGGAGRWCLGSNLDLQSLLSRLDKRLQKQPGKTGNFQPIEIDVENARVQVADLPWAQWDRWLEGWENRILPSPAPSLPSGSVPRRPGRAVLSFSGRWALDAKGAWSTQGRGQLNLLPGAQWGWQAQGRSGQPLGPTASLQVTGLDWARAASFWPGLRNLGVDVAGRGGIRLALQGGRRGNGQAGPALSGAAAAPRWEAGITLQDSSLTIRRGPLALRPVVLHGLQAQVAVDPQGMKIDRLVWEPGPKDRWQVQGTLPWGGKTAGRLELRVRGQGEAGRLWALGRALPLWKKALPGPALAGWDAQDLRGRLAVDGRLFQAPGPVAETGGSRVRAASPADQGQTLFSGLVWDGTITIQDGEASVTLPGLGLPGLTGQAPAQGGSPAFRQSPGTTFHLRRINASLLAAEERLTLSSFTAEWAGAQLDLRGRVDGWRHWPQASLDVQAHVRGLSLLALGWKFPAGFPLEPGPVDLDATVQGPANVPTLAGTLALPKAAWMSQALRGARASWQWQVDRFRIQPLAVQLGTGRLEGEVQILRQRPQTEEKAAAEGFAALTGWFAPDAGLLQLTGSGRLTDWPNGSLPGLEGAGLGGKVQAQAQFRSRAHSLAGLWDQVAANGELRLSGASWQGRALAGSGRWAWAGGRLQFQQAELANDLLSVTAQGGWGPSTGLQAQAQARIRDVQAASAWCEKSLPSLASWLKWPQRQRQQVARALAELARWQPAGSLAVQGELQAGGSRAPRGRFESRWDSAVLRGEKLGRVTALLQLDAGVLSVQSLNVEAGAGGAVTLTGAAQVEYATGSGQAQVQWSRLQSAVLARWLGGAVRGWQKSLAAARLGGTTSGSAQAHWQPNAGLSATGQLAWRQVQVALPAAKGGGHEIPLEADQARAAWTWSGQRLSVTAWQVDTPGGTLQGTASYGQPGGLDLEIRSGSLDVAYLWRQLAPWVAPASSRALPLLAGRIQVKGSVQGLSKGSLTLASTGLSIAQIPFDTAQACLTLDGRGNASLRELVLSRGPQRWTCSGEIRSLGRQPVLALRLDLQQVDVRDVSTLLGIRLASLGPLEGIRGSLGGNIQVEGPLSSPTAHAQLAFTGSGQQWGQVQGRFQGTLDRVGMQIAQLEATQGPGTLTASGSVSWNKQVDLQVAAHGFELAPLRNLLSLPQRTSGLLSLASHLSGSLPSPVAQVDFTVSHPVLAGMALDSIGGQMKSDGRKITVEKLALRMAGREATLTGTLPWAGLAADWLRGKAGKSQAGQEPIDLHLTVPDGDLALLRLADPRLDGSRARGHAEIRIGGTLARPVVEGTARVEGVAFSDPALGTLDGIGGVLLFHGNTLTIQQGRAQMGGGSLDVQGTVRMAGLTPDQLDLNVTAKGVQYKSSAFSSALDGRLTITGSIRNPRVQGQASLDRPVVNLDRLGSSQQPPPVNAQLNIQLVPKTYVLVQSAGTLEVWGYGSLVLGGTMRQPAFSGRLDALRGSITYMGTPFTIQQASAEFALYKGMIPDVSLVASTHLQDLKVYLEIAGPGDHLTHHLRSDPPRSEEELAGMLGLPGAITRVAQGDASAFGDEARRLLQQEINTRLMGGLEQQVAQALNLDQVRISPGIGGEPFRIELGKYLTDSVYMSYARTLGLLPFDQFRVEMRLDHNVLLFSDYTTEKGGNLSVGLEGRYRF